MRNLTKKLLGKVLRKNRVRARVHGTAARPRLSVFISNTHVTAQVINDDKQHTLASATTVGAKIDGPLSKKAEWVGTEVAKKTKKAKVSRVVFDRNGRKYAKRLQALAEAARKEGLEF
jgi:large subunit ribosomal protein L18